MPEIVKIELEVFKKDKEELEAKGWEPVLYWRPANGMRPLPTFNAGVVVKYGGQAHAIATNIVDGSSTEVIEHLVRRAVIERTYQRVLRVIKEMMSEEMGDRGERGFAPYEEEQAYMKAQAYLQSAIEALPPYWRKR
jgi:hypothetical protein